MNDRQSEQMISPLLVPQMHWKAYYMLIHTPVPFHSKGNFPILTGSSDSKLVGILVMCTITKET